MKKHNFLKRVNIFIIKKSLFLIFKSSNIIDLFQNSDKINRQRYNQGNISHINSNNRINLSNKKKK